RTDREGGFQFVFAGGVAIPHAANQAVPLDEPDDLGIPEQRERWKPFRARGDELEKVPLRHKRDVPELRRHTLERKAQTLARRRLNLHVRHLAVRQLQEFVGKAELIEQFERGRMDGVAAEVAKEVVVLFEDDDGNAGAGQKKAEYGPGGAAPGNGAGGSHHPLMLAVSRWQGEPSRSGSDLRVRRAAAPAGPSSCAPRPAGRRPSRRACDSLP